MQGNSSGFSSGPVLSGWSNGDEVDGARNTFLGKGGMAHTGFCGETLREETIWKI